MVLVMRSCPSQLVGIFKAAKMRNKKSPAVQSMDLEPESESTEMAEAETEPELAPEMEQAQPSPETEAEDPSTPEGSDAETPVEPEGSPVSVAHGHEEEAAGKVCFHRTSPSPAPASC